MWRWLCDWVMGRVWKSFDTLARNSDSKTNSDEISDGNEEYVIGYWKKGDFCYKVVKNVAKLCSSVLYKIERKVIKLDI